MVVAGAYSAQEDGLCSPLRRIGRLSCRRFRRIERRAESTPVAEVVANSALHHTHLIFEDPGPSSSMPEGAGNRGGFIHNHHQRYEVHGKVAVHRRNQTQSPSTWQQLVVAKWWWAFPGVVNSQLKR